MNKIRIILLILLGVLLSASTLEQQDTIVLQLRWEHQFQFAGYYAAAWQGFYDEQGLNVEIRSAVQPDGTILSATEEVLNGNADFGIGSADILLANDQKEPLSVTAVIFQESAAGFYMKESTPFHSLTDLTQLRVARRVNDLIDIELQAMLLMEGIDLELVPPYEHQIGFDHLFGDQVDVIPAYRSSTVYTLQNPPEPIREILPKDYGIDFYGDSLFTTYEFTQQNPELVERFVNASLKGWEYALENSEEIATDIAEKYDRVEVFDDELALNLITSEAIIDLTLYPIVAVGNINPYRWEKMHALMGELGLIENELDINQFVFDPIRLRGERIHRTRTLIVWGLAGAIGLLILTTSGLLLFRREVSRKSTQLNEAFIARQQIEKNLAQTNARLKRYVDNSTILLFGFEYVGHDIHNTWMSENVEGVLGFTGEEVNVPGWWSGHVIGENVLSLRSLPAFLSDDNSHFIQEFQFVHKNGKVIWIQENVSILRDENHHPKEAISIWTDITLRKKNETALKKSEADLRKAQVVSNIGSWVWYVQTNQLEWSEQMYVIFGIDQEKFTGNLSDVMTTAIHPDDQVAVEASNQAVSKEGTPIPLEYRVVWPDGTVRWVWAEAGELVFDDEGAPSVLTGIVQDITERKQAEAELQEKTNLLSSVTGSYPAYVGVVNRDFVIEFADGMELEKRGLIAEELIGLDLSIVFGPYGEEIYNLIIETLRKAFAGETSFVEYFMGREYEVLTAVPIQTQTDEIEKLLVISEIVTEKVQARHKLERQAFLQEKLVSLGAGLNATLDLARVYRLTQRAIEVVFPAANSEILLYDPRNNTLETVFSADMSITDNLVKEPNTINPILLNHDENPLVRAILSQKLVVEELSASKMSRKVIAPMLSQGMVIGLIVLESTADLEFTQQDVEWIDLAAGQVGLAIQNVRLYEQNRKRISQLTSLREIDSSINSHRSLKVTLQLLMTQVQHQLGFDAGDILFLNPETNRLECYVGFGFLKTEAENIYFHLAEGLPGQVFVEEKSVQQLELDENSQMLKQCAQWSNEGFQAYVGVPLMVNREIKGVLEVFHRQPLKQNRERNHFLETLAGQAAIAVDNYELLSGLQKTNQELIEAYDSTIEGWSQAMDLRDHDTEGHTQRVTALTLRIAQRMGFSETELAHIRRGALLHDIGKLGVPDNILWKPGPLTDDEWKIMRQHPEYAFGMLQDIDYLRPSIEIPYFHHEKWDGSGYPFGLSGDAIPLSARIFAVIDVWDALVTDRPYRKAWSEEKTVRYIAEQSGKHFDPEVVELFLKVLNES